MRGPCHCLVHSTFQGNPLNPKGLSLRQDTALSWTDLTHR